MSNSNHRAIAQASRKRNGKKYIVTKMITEIQQMIDDRGSRTKLKYLRDSLTQSMSEATEKHEELMLLLSEDDPNFNDVWIEELSLRVNTCQANIATYLIERENDTLSSSSSSARRQVETWIQQTNNDSVADADADEDPLQEIPIERTSQESNNDLANAFSKLNIGQAQSLVGPLNIPLTSNKMSNSLPNLTQPEDRRRETTEYFQSNQQRSNQNSFEKEDDVVRTSTFQNSMLNSYDENLKTTQSKQTLNLIKHSITKMSDGEKSADPEYVDNRHVKFHRYDNFETENNYEIEREVTRGINEHLHSTQLIGEKAKLMSRPNQKRDTKNSSYVLENYKHKAIDSWIDELDHSTVNIIPNERIHDVQMMMLIQQRLPPQKLPIFDGSAEKWVMFISSFFDMVHRQPYLDVFQKRSYLKQHLAGEAKKSIDGFANDIDGYIASLKRLKYMFGNPSLVAHATIQKVVNGGQIQDYDLKALTEFYYALSSCLNTLTKMNYTADIFSTDVLRQTLRRLPNYLIRKWAEYSFILRKREEPCLIHLEEWLQSRVMAAKDPYIPQDRSRRSGPRVNRGNMKEKQKQCPCCGSDHWMYKCERFKAKSDAEKLHFIKEKRLCFNCLSDGHAVKLCPSKRTCFIKGCNKRHHTFLHEALMDKKSNTKGSNNNKPDAKTNEDVQTGQINITKNDRNVFLQVVPVKVSNQNGDTIETFALLDNGSQCTIITKGLCQSLRLPGKLQKVQFGTIKDEETMNAKIVKLNISSIDGSFSTTVKNVYSLDEHNFNVPGQEVPVTSEPKWNYVRDITFTEVKPEQVQVLIGADVPLALISSEVRKGAAGLPIATKTPLGWTLVGVYEGGTSSSCFIRHLRSKTCDDANLGDIVKQFWETESYGTKNDNEEAMSIQDKRLLQILDNETSFKNGHYYVPMLWKSAEPLPDSLPVARKRLSPLIKRFQRDPSYFEMYRKNIDVYLENNYARKLSADEVKKTSDKTWYLPHHGVINENKPGKVRMVFDATAKSCQQSLNSNLSTGPDLLNSLLGVLLRFRKHKIAVVADIEAMYYQVRLNANDADAVRFLWKDNPEIFDEPDHYQMLVHILGASDSPCCSSYALRRAILDQINDFPKEVTDILLRNFYMDDLLSSVPDEEKAEQLIVCSAKLMGNSGFNLTKFNSNSKKVLDVVPIGKRAEDLSIQFESSITRALGVKWDLQNDGLIYQVDLTPTPLVTKRQILKKTSTIFDPMGFLAPFTIQAKMLLQRLWSKKVSWDEEVDDEIKNAWRKWLEELTLISKTISIPRSLSLESNQDVQLHVFCDASEKAFATVSYVRIEAYSNVRCHLLMAKTRVAPLKALTLPRLELQGAVIAVRMKATILKEFQHNFVKIILWTDSTLNIQCINNEHRRFKTFVSNRVSEIRQLTEPMQWRFVPGKLNPADIATRGAGIKEAKRNSVWFNGPDFLRLDEDQWPSTDLMKLPDDFNELRRINAFFVDETEDTLNTDKNSTFINFNRFSSWRKLIRTISWMIVFIKNCQKKVEKRTIGDLTIQEEKLGETYLIKLIQAEWFSEELKQLNKNIKKGALSKLDAFIDKESILRVGGRLKYGDYPYASKHQIILPSKHPAVVLLGKYFHSKSHHVGKEHLLSLLRQQYWIIGGRVMCKQIVRKCIICQKLRAKPSGTKMADLPEDRITASNPAFFNTGVDYFGPVIVKVLRSRVKRWGCIFTCLATRAIHLEVAPSLEADDFINVLERFICRRGQPKMIRSDCGTNFKGATNELRKELQRMDQLKIDSCLRRKQIEWQFNPPEAPHMGGAWERMVRAVKTSLHAILLADSTVLNDFTLLTVLTEIEALVNSRPLTPVSDDVNDMEALTPNHFIMGRASTVLPSCVVYDERITPKQRWKQVQSTTNQFWQRWRKEYLPTLTSRYKWMNTTRNAQVGDLVLVLDDSSIRGSWLLGRVDNTFPGRDGVVRKVEVRTKNGRYTRPVTKIARLELD